MFRAIGDIDCFREGLSADSISLPSTQYKHHFDFLLWFRNPRLEKQLRGIIFATLKSRRIPFNLAVNTNCWFTFELISVYLLLQEAFRHFD